MAAWHEGLASLTRATVALCPGPHRAGNRTDGNRCSTPHLRPSRTQYVLCVRPDTVIPEEKLAWPDDSLCRDWPDSPLQLPSPDGGLHNAFLATEPGLFGRIYFGNIS